MDSIVLRDRNGKEINYHGIDYLNVKTPDGETQGYAAYDPETLVPENLVSGVVVGDVEGALEVPQAVEKTIDPDFSAGDMEVVPEDGQVFSKVSIPKPANLAPANIAKDVDIAGVIGTMESGGGGRMMPMLFFRYIAYFSGRYTTNAFSETVSTYLPKSAIVLDCYGGNALANVSSVSANPSRSITNTTTGSNAIYPTITESGTQKTLAYKTSIVSTTTSTQTRLFLALMVILFNLQGVYYGYNDDGTYDIFADNTATELFRTQMMYASFRRIDLSNSNITIIPDYFIYDATCQEVILPPTVTQIGSNAFNYSSLKLLDMSRVTSVPTLGSRALSAGSGFQILVPSALYDEFIADTNWASYASYIVAV